MKKRYNYIFLGQELSARVCTIGPVHLHIVALCFWQRCLISWKFDCSWNRRRIIKFVLYFWCFFWEHRFRKTSTKSDCSTLLVELRIHIHNIQRMSCLPWCEIFDPLRNWWQILKHCTAPLTWLACKLIQRARPYQTPLLRRRKLTVDSNFDWSIHTPFALCKIGYRVLLFSFGNPTDYLRLYYLSLKT